MNALLALVGSLGVYWVVTGGLLLLWGLWALVVVLLDVRRAGV